MQFSLAKSGMLKLCNGQWTVTSVPGDSGCARVQLDQEMQPAFVPPPPFRRFMRKAMLGKAAQMLHQMRVSHSAPCDPPMPSLYTLLCTLLSFMHRC